MQYSFPLFLVLLLLLTISCSKDNCPEGRDLGYFRFSDTSLTFLQVSKCSTLTYQNDSRNEIRLSKFLEFDHAIENLCIVTEECDGFLSSLTGRNSCDFVSYNGKSLSYSSDSVDMRYILSFEALGDRPLLSENDTLYWVELFSTYFISRYSANANLHLISDLRGKEYHSREDSLVDNRYTFVPELRLRDTTYYNLYSSQDNTIWFKKELGIVAFEFQDDLYWLVDCE